MPGINGTPTAEDQLSQAVMGLANHLMKRATATAERSVPEGFRSLFKSHKGKEIRSLIFAIAEQMAPNTLRSQLHEGRLKVIEEKLGITEKQRIIRPGH